MAASDFETLLLGRIDREIASLDAPGSNEAGAAVALILAGDELEIPLIRRAENPRDPWSGHMALPGGRRDPADVSLEATAVRETLEETGIRLDAATIRGPLPLVHAMSGGQSRGFSVRPFVFRVAERPSTLPNHEVAELIWVKARHLAEGAERTVMRFERAGTTYRLPAWDLEGRIVWGLTHRVLATFLGVEIPNVGIEPHRD